jgi:hypothetical protein
VTLAAAAPPGAARLGAAGADLARGWPAAIALVLGTVGLAFAGPPAVAELLNRAYPVLAVVLAVALLRRRGPAAYLEFTLWLWLTTPLVRRIIDDESRYHEASTVMLAPPLCALAVLPVVLQARGRAYRDVHALFWVAAAVVAYGALVGALRIGPLPAAGAAVNLLAPLTLGAFVLTCSLDRVHLRAVLQRVALGGCAFLAVYGITQYLVLPPWDVAWIRDSGVGSVGRPLPLEVRVFGPLNTAGPFGQVIAVLLVLVLGSRRTRTAVKALVVGAALVALGLSLVRAAWLALLLVLVLLVVARRLPLTRVLAAAAALAAVLAVAGGPVTDAITDRASDTAAAGAQDNSLSSRLAFQSRIAPQALRDVVGQGLGSAGIASRLADEDQSVFVSFDSGVFETLYTLGSLPGLALLGAAVTAAVRSWRRALRQSWEEAFLTAPLLGLIAALVFTNTFAGVYGVVLWVLAGYAGRADTGPTA